MNVQLIYKFVIELNQKFIFKCLSCSIIEFTVIIYKEVDSKLRMLKKVKKISSRSIPSLIRLYDDIKDIVKNFAIFYLYRMHNNEK